MTDDQERQCILPRANEDGRSHRAMPDSLLCLGHDRQIRGYLTELANYPAALVAAVNAETKSVKLSSVTVTGSTEDRMPIGDDRTDHILNIHNMLWEWSGYVADSRGVNRPDLSDVWITARFLARHQLWITTQDSVARYHQGLRDIVSVGRGLLHPSKGPNRSQLPCPLTESEGCTGVLASLPTGDDDDETATTCDICGYVLPVHMFRTYRRQLHKRLSHDGSGKVSLTKEPAVLVTAEDLKWWAMAAGVPDVTLRSWLHRGELTGKDVGGRVLFDLDKAQVLVGRRKREKEAA